MISWNAKKVLVTMNKLVLTQIGTKLFLEVQLDNERSFYIGAIDESRVDDVMVYEPLIIKAVKVHDLDTSDWVNYIKAHCSNQTCLDLFLKTSL